MAKAEFLDKGQNPRFVVTSLGAEEWPAQDLYEKFYCARGEMENRIKEQLCLFADRLSTDEMKGNQLRFYFSALPYTLIEALRRLGLKGTAWAQAQVDTIRLKLLKIGAIVRISVRRILLQLSSAYPWKDQYAQAFHALRCCAPPKHPPTLHPPRPCHQAGRAMSKNRTARLEQATVCLKSQSPTAPPSPKTRQSLVCRSKASRNYCL